MSKKLYVDQENCSICKLCVDEYPQSFRMSPEGPAEVYKADNLSQEEIDDILGLCPASCIHYE